MLDLQKSIQSKGPLNAVCPVRTGNLF